MCNSKLFYSNIQDIIWVLNLIKSKLMHKLVNYVKNWKGILNRRPRYCRLQKIFRAFTCISSENMFLFKNDVNLGS